MMNEQVCVVGASGHLGYAVVQELVARQFPVVAVVRRASPGNANHNHTIEQLRSLKCATIAIVDASNVHETYTHALRHSRVVISCLAATPREMLTLTISMSSNNNNNNFWTIDRDANIRLACQALEQASVRHFVLVATREGPEGRHVSEFLQAKEEAVEYIERACVEHNVTCTIVRPNAYFKDLTDRAFASVRDQDQHTVIGKGNIRINPIAREDVASFIADCIQHHKGGDCPLGGPDVFTLKEIGILAAHVMGKQDRLKIVRKPIFGLHVLAFVFSLMGWLYRPARCKAALIHWMIYVSTHDAVAPCHGKRHLQEEYSKKFKGYS